MMPWDGRRSTDTPEDGEPGSRIACRSGSGFHVHSHGGNDRRSIRARFGAVDREYPRMLRDFGVVEFFWFATDAVGHLKGIEAQKVSVARFDKLALCWITSGGRLAM